MVESTRVAKLGTVDIHLKHRLTITTAVASGLTNVPSSEEWYVLLYNTNTDDWEDLQLFDDFVSADDMFVSLVGQNGGTASNLSVGPDDEASSRTIGF